MKKTHITVLFLFITQLLCMVAYGANGFRPLKGIVAFHKQRDAIEYTTIIRFEVSFSGEEAPKSSYLFTGRLPKGIRRGAVNPEHMLCFKYKHKNEILIKPKLFVSRTTDDYSRIVLISIEDATTFFHKTGISTFFRYGERGPIPDTHVVLLLKGDIADMYIICRKEDVRPFLNVIASGCKVSEQFNNQWIGLKHRY